MNYIQVTTATVSVERCAWKPGCANLTFQHWDDKVVFVIDKETAENLLLFIREGKGKFVTGSGSDLKRFIKIKGVFTTQRLIAGHLLGNGEEEVCVDIVLTDSFRVNMISALVSIRLM